PEAYRIGRAPGGSEEGLAEGRRIYEEIECWKCHGDAGRGDGTSAPTLEDDGDLPIRAADLSEPWNFNGGGTVEAVFTRLRTGLDGTPMPTFSDLIDANVLTEEQLWRLAQYVRSLGPEEAPRVREVVRAVRVDGPLPASPDDSSWNAVERFYFPLVAQIVVRSRWFVPRVDGVFVQAAHNGEDLALRLVWHDPSESPAPAWLEWQEKVLRTMYTDADEPPASRPRPDAFAVQFPTRMPTGTPRPYLLMGDATNPVYLWHWQSEPDRALEAEARGMTRIEPQPRASQTLRHQAVFDRGEWRVQFTRPLATADSTNEIQFAPGAAIPIGFFAWDGDNAEEGTRAAVGAWYYLALEEPTPPTVYVTPALAAVLTAGLGLLAVWRAQRRSREPRG
ncbi:MAG: ethylbenzene dehydrogenase-related protein, partial [Gemmatimonadota bacterium]